MTERAVVRHPDVVTCRLEELRSLGVRVAIDDFGTGYNGLGTLKDFPFDIIKVGRYFVTGLCVDPVDRAVLTAIVTLARALRLEVIAEGVETVSQAAELRHLGCTYAQGYLGEFHQSVHGPGHGDRCH
ncbi:MAG: EAL domain-containing protein [Acidimicrobiales bacterium]